MGLVLHSLVAGSWISCGVARSNFMRAEERVGVGGGGVSYNM